MSIDSASRRATILRQTHLQCVPLVPELCMHLADEIDPLWKLIQEEAGGQDVPPPFWAFAWVGGQAIARYLLDHPAIVRGKRVIDFATGSGLCAIAAMHAGATEVLAADIDPWSADAIPLNAAANGVIVTFTEHDLLAANPPAADLILAGDICYEASMAARVLAWLHIAHARGTHVLIGDPGRHYFPRTGLTRLAEYDVPTTRELEGRDVTRAGVFTISPP